MKLVFANHATLDNPGTIVKVESQAQALKEVDPNCEVIAFYHGDKDRIKRHNDLVKYVRLPFSLKRVAYLLPGFISDYLMNIGADVVILRSISLSPMFWYHFRKRSYKLITEHHTKVVMELLALKRFLAATSTVLSRPIINRMIDGKICVTPEILSYEFSSKPAVMISNGVLLSNDEVTSFASFDGAELKLVMLCSWNYPWHGCPRIFRSIITWESQCDLKITLDLIGDLSVRDFPGENIPKGVVFHGQKNRDQLTKIMKSANLAISTLALYEKKMDEACPRKSRDYIARGLPFIYGYRDPDIFESDSFALRVPNNDSLIPLNRVLEFVKFVNENREKVELEMADAAKNRISWTSKMQEYYDFGLKVLESDNDRSQ